MEWFNLTVSIVLAIGLAAFITSYYKKPKFRAAVNKKAAAINKWIVAQFWMLMFKWGLFQLKRNTKKHEGYLKAQQDRIAHRFNKATGKQYKAGGLPNNQQKQEKANKQQQNKPDVLNQKRANVAYMMFTTNWQELDCYEDLLNVLAAEAERKAKKKGISLQVGLDGIANVYMQEPDGLKLIARVNPQTNEVHMLRNNKAAAQLPEPQPVRQGKAIVFEADQMPPEPPMTKERIRQLEEEANRQ